MSVYTKLAQFQGKFDGVELNATNPHFKNKYATLSEVINKSKPVLSAVGLGFTQVPYAVEGTFFIDTILFDAEKPEDQIKSTVDINRDNNPQKLGSTLTYYKRYCLCAMLGISEMEDDDGNAGAKEPERKTQPQKPKIATYQDYINGCDFFLDNKKTVAEFDTWIAGKEAEINKSTESEKIRSYANQIKQALQANEYAAQNKEDLPL